MNPRGQVGITYAGVKACLILNDHMLGGGIAGGNLLEKVPAELQIYRGHETKLGAACPHF